MITTVENTSGHLKVHKEFTYQWNVYDYEMKNKKFGQDVKSDYFEAFGSSWHLSLFPFGDYERNQDSFSIFLVKNFPENDNSNVSEDEIHYSLNLLTDKKEENNNPTAFLPIFCHDHGWGGNKYVKRNMAMDENNVLLKGDYITIECKLIVDDVDEHTASISDSSLQNTTVLKDFENMINNQNFADVKLIIGKESLYAHKIILSSRSEVFNKIFENDNTLQGKKLMDEIEIIEVKYDVMVELIGFLYTGKTIEIDETMVRDLFIAANLYGVKDLKLLCERRMYMNLSIDNAFDYLHIADKYCASVLKEEAIKFISKYSKEIAGRPEFQVSTLKDFPMKLFFEIFCHCALREK